MGRLQTGLLRRATLTPLLAALIIAGQPAAPVCAQDGDSAAEPERVRLEESILADVPGEVANPMEAIAVLLNGGTAGTAMPPTLLNFSSNAVIGGNSTGLSELDARLMSIQQRDRINAMSMAIALDDLAQQQRFGHFPEPQPSISVEAAPAASEQKTAPRHPGPKPAAKQQKQPATTQVAQLLDSDNLSFRAADIGSVDESALTAAELSAYRREQTSRLNKMLDNWEGSLDQELESRSAQGSADEVLPASSGALEDSVEAGTVSQGSAIGMAAGDSQAGFHGLLDLSTAASSDAQAAAASPKPGSAVNSMTMRMVIFTVALLLLASFLKGKGNPLARLNRRSMKVLETISLGPGRQIMIVETQGANLVLGVTGGGINLLERLPQQASGEDYRDNVQDIISRESAADEASWKQKPALDLVDSGLQVASGNERKAGHKPISVSELRRVRGSAGNEGNSAPQDRHAELVSRVRRQLERARS